MKPYRIDIWHQPDGWHWCPKSIGFRDTRGPSFYSRHAAILAARAFFAAAESTWITP